MTILETFEHKGYRVNIVPDNDPQNPRDFCCASKMIFFHRKYTLGDKHNYDHGNYNNWSELAAEIRETEEPVLMFSVYMYDHSSLAFSIDSTPFHIQDSAGWDWGQLGFIIVTEEHVRDIYGKAKFTTEELTKHVKVELETYQTYVNGHCVAYEIRPPAKYCECCKQELEQDERYLCGFYDVEYCKQEAIEEIDSWLKEPDETAHYRSEV